MVGAASTYLAGDFYETDFANGNLIPQHDVVPSTVPFPYTHFGSMSRGSNGFSSGTPPDSADSNGLTIFVNHDPVDLSSPSPHDASETLYLVPPGSKLRYVGPQDGPHEFEKVGTDPLNFAQRMLATLYFDEPRSFVFGTQNDSDNFWGIALNFKSGNAQDAGTEDIVYGVVCQFRPNQIHFRGTSLGDFVIDRGNPTTFERKQYRLEIEMKRTLTTSSVTGTIAIDGNVSPSGSLAPQNCPPTLQLAASDPRPITAVGFALVNQYAGVSGAFKNSTIQARFKSFRLRFDPLG